MTVVNPPGFLQNAGATHTAEITRNILLGHSAGRLAASSLKARGGVMRDLGSGLAVVENGAPNMSVNIGSGHCYIPGSEGTTQGMYSCLNNGSINVALAAANPTNPRIDRISFKVEDAAYSGAANTSSIVAVTGTPASSPSAPAAPNNSLTLATILIPANDTAVTNSQITDTRLFMAAPGGTIICVSTARPDTATISSGQQIYETDTKRKYTWDGTDWIGTGAAIDWVPFTPAWTALSGSAPSIGNGSLAGRWRYLSGDGSIHMEFRVVGGTTTSWGSGGILAIGFPTGLEPSATSIDRATFAGWALDPGNNEFPMIGRIDVGPPIRIRILRSDTRGEWSSGSPMVWGNGDSMRGTIIYEPA